MGFREGGDSMPSVRVRQRAKGAMFTAMYRDPSGRQRSAGTFTSERAALRAARRSESKVETGGWIDHASGRITFREYVEQVWLPSRHVEVSTLAGYHSYPVSYTHLRAHETRHDLVCRLLLE